MPTEQPADRSPVHRKKGKPSAYQRIIRNAQLGKGVVLSADEVWHLAMDDSISAAALQDDLDDEGKGQVMW